MQSNSAGLTPVCLPLSCLCLHDFLGVAYQYCIFLGFYDKPLVNSVSYSSVIFPPGLFLSLLAYGRATCGIVV